MIPKFRAWHKELKEMSTVDAIFFAEEVLVTSGIIFPATDRQISKHEWGFKDVVLMEWTGLQDKNGKDIYAEDIIEYNDEMYIVPHPIPTSRWNEATNINLRRDNTDDWNSWPECYEIMGNVFQNPELLESK